MYVGDQHILLWPSDEQFPAGYVPVTPPLLYSRTPSPSRKGPRPPLDDDWASP